MANKTISELNTATLSDNLVMVVEGASATEKTTVSALKEYVGNGKQDTLTAGTNITIENNVISATGSSITVDNQMSNSSENPVQNKVITAALANKADSSSLATVATSGSYNDLSNKPTIPAAQIQADWEQSDNTALDYIKNKPTIPSGVIVDQVYDGTSQNAQSGVAIAGAGFLTQHQDISGKQDVSNLVTSLSNSSTDAQYPSAKCVYDLIGDIESALAAI